MLIFLHPLEKNFNHTQKKTKKLSPAINHFLATTPARKKKNRTPTKPARKKAITGLKHSSPKYPTREKKNRRSVRICRTSRVRSESSGLADAAPANSAITGAARATRQMRPQPGLVERPRKARHHRRSICKIVLCSWPGSVCVRDARRPNKLFVVIK